MAKHLVLLICFLTWLQIITAGLIREGFLAKIISHHDWLETFSQYTIFPDPTIMVLVLVVSLCLWTILSFLGRRTRKAPSSLPSPRPLEPFPQSTSLRKNHVSQPRHSPTPPTIVHQDRVKVEEEWRRLEEADKEAIRAIVSQGGLWETDIIALLETRGFLHPKATLDSLAERVSFVDCDYAGYHSIPQVYFSQLVSVLDSDNAQDSF